MLSPSPTSQVTSRLRDKHQVSELRVGLTRYLNRTYPNSFRNPASVLAQPDGSPAYPKLKEHNVCLPQMQLLHYQSGRDIRAHLEGTPEWPAGLVLEDRRLLRRRLPTGLDSPCPWVDQQYWVVKKNGSLFCSVADNDVCAHLQLMHERERKRLESDKHAYSYAADTEAQTLAATRPWMERT